MTIFKAITEENREQVLQLIYRLETVDDSCQIGKLSSC
jgi:hypothetical protein